MIKKILFLVLALSSTAAVYADRGTDVWTSIANWRDYCPHDEMGNIIAYSLVDVDRDGISECFVRGDYDSCGLLTCSDGQGNAGTEHIRLVANTLNSTYLILLEWKGRRYVSQQGSCGGGCAVSEYYKIERSTLTSCYQGLMVFSGMEDHGVEAEYNLIKPNAEPRRISRELFERSTPGDVEGEEVEALEWQAVENPH